MRKLVFALAAIATLAFAAPVANAGHDTRRIQDWLGHQSIQHTVRYTELSPTRFKDFYQHAAS